MHDNAGRAAVIGGDRSSPDAPRPSGPNPRMVAATAMPTANSVMIVNAPLAIDLSARSSVASAINPKNPAAANVSHIGNDGERQMKSSDVAQAQFMRGVPQRMQHKVHSAKMNADSPAHPCAECSANRAFF